MLLLPLLISLAAVPDLVAVEELNAHPRPDWARPCTMLDGAWRFDFDPADAGQTEKWHESHAWTKSIRVPYPWQSPLSGIGDATYQGTAWYERDIAVPRDFDGKRLFLVFGAVDSHATVWLDGQPVAEHEGGYTPFEVELTGRVKPGAVARLTVRAHDVSDPETPTGKQIDWYTPTGGIWQSVYLELRGQTYLRQARITPDIDNQNAAFAIDIDAPAPGAYQLHIQSYEGSRRVETKQRIDCTAGINHCTAVLPLPSPALWTPQAPHLYNTRLSLRRDNKVVDSVQTYFGMRKIARGVYGDAGHEYILLNGKPIYLRGALHQSFNPQGIYTHPNEDFMRNDYEKAKELGFNFIRIHIKAEEPRALYWADRTGVMLMCDIPNYKKNTPRAQALWEQTLRATVARDFNHPAIIAWCDFNETWGIGDGGYTPETQAWVRSMYELTKQLDPTRLVEDNSPCRFDHVKTDINSWHFYLEDWAAAATHVAEVVEKTFPGSPFNYVAGCVQDTAPLINSEYGGLSARGGDRDIAWPFLHLTSLLRKYDKICGYVYTELSDIEWEHNGLLNYDRSPKIFNYPAGITPRDLQNDDFIVLDAPPYQRVEATATVPIPVLYSHWSERDDLRLHVYADGQTVDGTPWSAFFKPLDRELKGAPYRVTPQEPLNIILPDASGILNVIAEILHDGQRVAANYCVIDVRNGAAWTKPEQLALGFPVGKYAAHGFDKDPFESGHDGKVFGCGAGYIEYILRLPGTLTPAMIDSCRLVAEVGAKAFDERLDWPAKRNPLDYPQTDGKQWPSDIEISIDGKPFYTATLADDFADARGVLSNAEKWHHASCGQIIDAPIEGEALAALQNALAAKHIITLRFAVKPDAPNKGGIALYGNQMGQWPADPTLVFTLKPGVKKPRGKIRPSTPNR